jgi:hypothetical protein
VRLHKKILTFFFRLKVWHDNSGFGASWFLDKIIVETGTGEKYYFPCGKWLADDEGDENDRTLMRELSAVKEDSTTYLPLAHYKITVITGDRYDFCEKILRKKLNRSFFLCMFV